MIAVHYNGIADCSFEYANDSDIDKHYDFGGSYYGWSTNPVRTSIFPDLSSWNNPFNQ